jgi:hypothetical protein
MIEECGCMVPSIVSEFGKIEKLFSNRKGEVRLLNKYGSDLLLTQDACPNDLFVVYLDSNPEADPSDILSYPYKSICEFHWSYYKKSHLGTKSPHLTRFVSSKTRTALNCVTVADK